MKGGHLAGPIWLTAIQLFLTAVALVGLGLIGLQLYSDVSGNAIALRHPGQLGVALVTPMAFFVFGRVLQSIADRDRSPADTP